MTSNLTSGGTVFAQKCRPRGLSGSSLSDRVGCFEKRFLNSNLMNKSYTGYIWWQAASRSASAESDPEIKYIYLFVLLKTRFMMALADHRLGRTLAFPVMQFVAKQSRWR